VVVECSEGASTYSSPVDGLSLDSTSTLMEEVLEPLFWLVKFAKTLHTAEVFGELPPYVPMQIFHFNQRLTLVPYEPHICPCLYLCLLLELRFPGHPQPC
jgi:hypothetical protein